MTPVLQDTVQLGVKQIIKADRELWTILAQEHKETVRPSNDLPCLEQELHGFDYGSTCYDVPSPSAGLSNKGRKCSSTVKSHAHS